MRFSIALCTYNGARFLNEQLKSFAEQSRLPDELVVSDDCSTDETVLLLEAFAASAPFPIHIVRNPKNLGYSRNFTETVLRCSGDIIALSDQDDVWFPNKLERLEEVFQAIPELQGVFSDGEIIDDNSKPVGRTLWKSFLFGPSDQARFASGDTLDVLLRRNVVTGMAFAFRRAKGILLIDRPSSWMHDGWLAIAFALEGGLQACPDRLVGYRVHGAQQVGTPSSVTEKLRWLFSKGPKNYARSVHAKNLDEYQRTSAQFDDLYRHLSRHSDTGQGVLHKVVQKAEHAHRGARALTLPRPKRFFSLLPHAVSYLRFSPNGLRGLIRDLIV